jgi:hypothetical protein
LTPDRRLPHRWYVVMALPFGGRVTTTLVRVSHTPIP